MTLKLIKREDIILKTQEDLFKALIAAYTLKNKATNTTCKLVSGTVESNDGLSGFYFKYPDEWEVYEEKTIEWYENIPEQGVLCWVENDSGEVSFKRVALIGSYNKRDKCKDNPIFVTKGGGYYKVAIPLTKEEVINYIYA